MRKVILYIAMSLDGFIADEQGKVGWLLGEDAGYPGDYGYEAFARNVDTVIMGRKTYDQIVTELSPDTWVYGGMKTYVLTHEKRKDRGEKIIFFSGRTSELVETLKKESGKDIWVCGGSEVVRELMGEDLIDEYRLSVMPVILGGGIRLFLGNHSSMYLHLKESRVENGVVCFTYVRRWPQGLKEQRNEIV